LETIKKRKEKRKETNKESNTLKHIAKEADQAHNKLKQIVRYHKREILTGIILALKQH